MTKLLVVVAVCYQYHRSNFIYRGRSLTCRERRGAASLADLGQYSDSQTRDSRHSHPLALTQLLLVYHLLRAKQLDQVMI